MFKASLNIVYAAKTITIKEEVLNRLSLQKGKDESFSDLLEDH
jgi:predicted CopG family antitoxin